MSIHTALPEVNPLSSAELSFQILTELKQVMEIAVEWDALLAFSNCNRAFSSATWYLAAFVLQEDASPYVLIARRRGVLAGVLPLVISHHTRQAEFAMFANDYCDIIAKPEDHLVVSHLLRLALEGEGKIESIFLDRIRIDSNCFPGLGRLLPESRLAQVFLPDNQSYSFVRPYSSYEDYLATRRGKFRRNLLRARRNAEGMVQVEQVFPVDLAPARLAEIFLSIHLARFHDKTPFRLLPHQTFLQTVLPPLFSADILRVFVMKKQEKIVAMDLCVRGASSLCAWSGGFLPEACEWSPGMMLIDHEIRAVYEQGMAEFDLMRGSEEYKASWATNLRTVGSVDLKRSDGRF